MSLFEYLAIAFSLVFSFSAMRLVSGLPHALESSRRYAVHLLHVLWLLFAIAAVFWSFWSFRDLEWNFLRFLSLLAPAALLYFLACNLVPDTPSSITSWRSYFYQVRKRYFLGIGIFALVTITNTTVLLGMPLWHPIRGLQAFVLAFAIVGAATDSPSIHGVIAIASWFSLIALGFLVFLPGSFAH